MSNEIMQETTPLVECSAFHRGMSVLEVSLRNTKDSEAIINVEAPDKSSGKRRQKVHIEYDLVGYTFPWMSC